MLPETTSSDCLQLERRAVLEVRAEQKKIVGHAIVFDTRSHDLGGFVEIVRASSVVRALDAGADISALYNHDPGAVLGRTPRTLTLSKDARGLAFTLDPAPTQAGRDVFELVRRGDITGASFGFRTLKDAWHQDGRLAVRELLDIELVEISLTAFPSYQQTDVSVAQRALQVLLKPQVLKSDIPESVVLKSQVLKSQVRWLQMRARVR
jgi:HK97 family phage prohead protease